MGYFIGGLPGYIKKYLDNRPPDNMAEALHLAKLKEAVGPEKQEDVEELNAKMDLLISKLDGKDATVAAATQEEKTIRCSYCGETYHFAAYCPYKQDEAARYFESSLHWGPAPNISQQYTMVNRELCPLDNVPQYGHTPLLQARPYSRPPPYLHAKNQKNCRRG